MPADTGKRAAGQPQRPGAAGTKLHPLRPAMGTASRGPAGPRDAAVQSSHTAPTAEPLEPLTRYPDTACMLGGMWTGKIAERAGVNPQTPRSYARRGILPEPHHSPAGYRDYPDSAVRMLRFIKWAQQLRFTLDDGDPDGCVQARSGPRPAWPIWIKDRRPAADARNGHRAGHHLPASARRPLVGRHRAPRPQLHRALPATRDVSERPIVRRG